MENSNTYKYCTVVTLFGLSVEEKIGFSIDLNNKSNTTHNEDDPTKNKKSFPSIKFTFIPWSTDESNPHDKHDIETKIIKEAGLPKAFDCFDGFNDYAFGTPNQLDAFTIRTQADTQIRCSCILLIEYILESDFIGVLILPGYNELDEIVINPLLNGIRLLTEGEPYPYKAYSLYEKKLCGNIIKWPMGDINYPKIELNEFNLKDLEKNMIFLIKIRKLSDQNVGYRIITNALGFFHFAATLRDERTAFLHYMIAIDGLFRLRPTKGQKMESPDSPASRMAQLMETSPKLFFEIKNFISSSDAKTMGCYQIRNEIVHGGTYNMDLNLIHKLRGCLIISTLEVIRKVIPKMKSTNDYYNALQMATPTHARPTRSSRI